MQSNYLTYGNLWEPLPSNFFNVTEKAYKKAWPTIIAALISLVTTNEIKVVKIYLSSTFLQMIYWDRKGLPLQGEMKG